jgi:PhzF family phenazine biosynthesis protein
MKFSLISVFTDPSENKLGNISAVVMLQKEISDQLMQQIAIDFNQPATTFLWKDSSEKDYHIRWFAPDSEIGLCGHGSMAATAYLVQKKSSKSFSFNHKSGRISGLKGEKGFCSITLPAVDSEEIDEIPEKLKIALKIPVLGFFKTSDKYIVLTDNEETVKNMKPNFLLLKELEFFGYAVTAKGNEFDFVSRTLVPHIQQLEDPATGSSHAALVPFWAKRTNKNLFVSSQLSKRGGKFYCQLKGEEVFLKGSYFTIAEGELFLR